MRATIGLVAAAILAISGCGIPVSGAGPAIKGSGVTKEESRDVPAFTGVDVSANFEATVDIGPKASVTLSVDDNLLPLVKTDVKDGRLVVGYVGGQTIRTTKPQKVTIVTPSLDFVRARGASKVTATAGEASTFKAETEGASSIQVGGLVAESVEVKAEGASRITLTGKGKRLTLDVMGASKATMTGASFESAKVDVGGASRGELNVTGSIDGEVSGASSLSVRGNPTTRDVKTSGASKVSY